MNKIFITPKGFKIRDELFSELNIISQKKDINIDYEQNSDQKSHLKNNDYYQNYQIMEDKTKIQQIASYSLNTKRNQTKFRDEVYFISPIKIYNKYLQIIGTVDLPSQEYQSRYFKDYSNNLIKNIVDYSHSVSGQTNQLYKNLTRINTKISLRLNSSTDNHINKSQIYQQIEDDQNNKRVNMILQTQNKLKKILWRHKKFFDEEQNLKEKLRLRLMAIDQNINQSVEKIFVGDKNELYYDHSFQKRNKQRLIRLQKQKLEPIWIKHRLTTNNEQKKQIII